MGNSQDIPTTIQNKEKEIVHLKAINGINEKITNKQNEMKELKKEMDNENKNFNEKGKNNKVQKTLSSDFIKIGPIHVVNKNLISHLHCSVCDCELHLAGNIKSVYGHNTSSAETYLDLKKLFDEVK